MTIRPLPPAPSRDDPGSFSDKANTLLAALPDFVSDANALEQSLQWVATTGTSATPLTIGTGSKTLTTQPDKAWVVGAWVYVVSVSGLGNIMQGQVTAYNVVTGSLTLNVVGAAGSGTRSDWIIGLAAAIASAGTIGVADAANRFAGGNIEAVLTELARLDGDIIKAGGNATDPLHLVPKQQAESIAAGAAADRVRIQRLTPVATTSGSTVALSTTIPSWVAEIDLVFAGVSINSGNSILVQVGAGGLATSGYISTSTTASNAGATSAFSATNGFAVELAGGPPNALQGLMRLAKLDPAGNTWVQSHAMTKNATNSIFGGGQVTLAGSLTHLSLVCNNGGDAFDAGSVSLVLKG